MKRKEKNTSNDKNYYAPLSRKFLSEYSVLLLSSHNLWMHDTFCDLTSIVNYLIYENLVTNETHLLHNTEG